MRSYSIFILIVLILAIVAAIVFFQLICLPKESFSEKEIVFSVEKGQGLKEIASNLEKENLIRKGAAFGAYTLAKGTARNLKAGDYILSPSMNIPQIAEKLFLGETIKEKITLVEGWNLREIAFYFEEKGISEAEEFWQLVGFPLVDYSKRADLPQPKDFSEEFSFLKDKPEKVGLEGYLFPDTYEINEKEESSEEIVRKMLKNFERKLTSEMKREIKNQEKSIFEVITMASLIEKEVRTFEDKKLASGILWKRLEAGMPLQVDATIAYILEAEGWDFDQMRKEVALGKEIDSPYNTYKYKSLPLGPISNPGLGSIIAAIEPEKSDFWYYLSTREGETIFSRTLPEHNLARAKYLK